MFHSLNPTSEVDMSEIEEDKSPNVPGKRTTKDWWRIAIIAVIAFFLFMLCGTITLAIITSLLYPS
jgi:hypothetical protein